MGKIYTDWEKHAKTAEHRLWEGWEGGEERDCTWGREARKRLNETRTIQNVTNSTDNCSLWQYSAYVQAKIWLE